MDKKFNLSDNEKNIKHILKHMPYSVIAFDLEGGEFHIRFLSESCAGVIGFTADELCEGLAQNPIANIYSDDLSLFAKDQWDRLQDSHSFTFRTVCKNGRLKWVHLELTRVAEDGDILFYGILSSADKQQPPSGKYRIMPRKHTVEAVSKSDRNALQGADFEQPAEKNQKLFDYIPGGIGIYDLYNGVASLQFLNNSYLTMMGLKKDDRAKYYGNDISEIFYSEDRHILTEMIEQIYNGKLLINVLFRIRNGSGKLKWINLVMRVVQEKNRHYTGYASLYDFDRVIKSQQEMEAARKKEETLLSGIPGGIAIYHVCKSGRVTTEYVSEPLAKMCGYTAEEFLAYLKDNALINLVPEDIPIVSAAVAKSLENHRNISLTYRIYKKDKTPILIRLDANKIQSSPLADDEIAVFYAVHTVVSDESKRIIEEQKNLSMLLNSVPAGIGIYEMRNGVLNQEYLNDAFFGLLHSTRQERLQYSKTNAIASIYPDDMEKVRKYLDSLIQGASMVQGDCRLINPLGGYMWFHITASVTKRDKDYIRFFAAFFDCSESKKQELLLLQNERAVELAQNHGDMAIWTYNIDKGIIHQQIHLSQIGHMGYQVNIERVPEFFIESGSVYPDDIQLFLKAYRELAEGKESVDVTYRLINKRTGKFAWIRMFYQRMENNDENERMAVGFSMNVEKQQHAIERYQTEQALRKQMNSNVLLYIEYNLTNDSFEVSGKLAPSLRKDDWENISADEFMQRLYGFVDKPFANEVAEKMHSKNLMKSFEAGETRVYAEFRCRTEPNLPSVWFRSSVSIVKRPDTGDIMAFVFIENIEKEKERKLAIESSLSDGIESIAVINVSDGRTMLIRDEYKPEDKVLSEEYFTYDDDFVWRSHQAVVNEDSEFSYRSALLSNIIKELAQREVFQYSIGTHSRTGVFKRQLFRFRYLDDRRTAVVLSVSDITSVYMEEQEKKKQIEQALAETKKASAAKAEFYSRMSHDMRTPMNGILGMTALSESECSVTTLRENMDKIRESGEYLLNLINDTLDIQRIESGKLKLEPQIVNTKKALVSILEMIQPMANAKGVILQFDKGNADINWYVRTDPVRVKQIFVNLLSNAIKFTPAGGTVKFSSHLLERDGMISHDVFTISDTGIGMSRKFLEDGIFRPFSQENNPVTANYAGSGLGLSIVKSLVELMNGRIEVESEPGAGTTFTVHLDFQRIDKAEAERILYEQRTSSKDITSVLNGKNILLVEDHPLNAEIAKKMLGKVGCSVTWAQNGLLGVKTFAASEDGFFDAVLMDIRMPVMDGLEATRQIRALEKADAKAVPIIAMTANAYEDDIKKSSEAGMNSHLGKPIEPQKLFGTLAEFFKNSNAEK